MSEAKPAIVALGKYQIRGVLGRGAMGTVYDGWDPVIGRRVAIKTVRMFGDDDPEAREGLARFKNEAQAAGRLSNPNIVAVYDYGESDDTAFIVMEFVEGHSLKERLDTKEPVPLGETARVMQQVLAGLQFSHDKGVVHRDIKPGNVMLTRDGQVKLADFGIARIESSVMTQAGTMLGTPAYMSPEQLMGQAVDARSDIYSSGVLLYQLLTGERPFEGGMTTIIHKALNTTPPRPSEISVTAPPALDCVVVRAMAKRPADRYPNAAAFARALREAFDAQADGLMGRGPEIDAEATMFVAPARTAARPGIVPVPPSRPQAAKPGRRLNPVSLGGAAVVLLGLIGGGWFALRSPEGGPGLSAGISPTAPHMATPPIVAPASPAVVATPRAAFTAPTPTEPKAAAVVPPGPGAETRAIAPTSAPAPVNVPAIRDALNSLGVSAPCALPKFFISDNGGVRVSGLVGSGTGDVALLSAVRALAPDASLTWDARTIDGPYCDVLDVIRPIAQPGSPFLGLTLQDDLTRLKAHDSVLPVLKLPDFSAYLLVDYFSHDGSVAHLYPIRGVSASPFAANATVRLGTSATDRVEVGPPFGTDVVVATASSVPLFPPGAAREDETTQIYLPVLKAAIEAARRRDAKLAGQVLAVDTVER
jgi:serine/threonine-protein kinase